MISIIDYGTLAHSPEVQTKSLQSALNAAGRAGGGVVRVPAGVYLTGTLMLPSHVTLHLESGAVLRGSSRLEDYPEVAGGFTDAVGQSRNRCLIYSSGTRGVCVTGSGTIDGNGGAYAYDAPGRPFLLRFVDCTDVQVTGVTLKDSPGWVSHYLGCENVLIQGITIHSHVNGNNDGIDIDSCRRVRIIGCDIDTGDDAVCLKSTRATPCENIVVTGCLLRSIWGALKIGTESAGDIRNVLMSDCIIRDTCGGGLKIISMDGARIENVLVHNLVMDRVSGPIFLRLGARLREYHADQPKRGVGSMRNISIRNITGTVWEEGYLLYGKLPRKSGIIITGIPGHTIEDLTLENIKLEFPGGGATPEAGAVPVPEQETDYPEFPAFHPLPSWGFYVRHARGVTFRDIALRTSEPEGRPALVTEDVSDFECIHSFANEKALQA